MLRLPRVADAPRCRRSSRRREVGVVAVLSISYGCVDTQRRTSYRADRNYSEIPRWSLHAENRLQRLDRKAYTDCLSRAQNPLPDPRQSLAGI